MPHLPDDHPILAHLAKAHDEALFGPGTGPSQAARHHARVFYAMFKAMETAPPAPKEDAQ